MRLDSTGGAAGKQTPPRPTSRDVFAPAALAWLLTLAAGLAGAQPAAPAADSATAPPAAASSPAVQRLAPVVVTATRTEARPFDVPASIDVIGGDELRAGRPQVNLSESLGRVPGLLVRDRQNYAQDLQISVRGFGARSTFGIRGVRLYVDGIPATLPDGQGQISNVDLGSAERIEVLRGPFSALYGNSSGGVITVETEEGRGPPTLGFGVGGGSDGGLRVQTRLAGGGTGYSYLASASHFRTDGYREHSAAARDIGNIKLGLEPDGDSRLTVVVNSVSMPKAHDPLGLTRANFEKNPRGVEQPALDFNTRKTVDQTQGGLIYERRLDDVNSLRALVYTGHRGTEQFQAIPTGPQQSPLHPGGVIDLGRDYRGADLRWTMKTTLAERPFSLVAGLAYDALDEHRRGYQNFVGTTLGVQGALRRDEDNQVWNFDQYLQASWQVAPAWTVNAGLRHSDVRFESADHYVVGPNGDDSGAADHGATLPVFGVMYALSSKVHLYATAGRGFETPTLNEIAYRDAAQAGLNFGLRPARSTSLEAGVKMRDDDWGDLDVAVFQTRTRDEIVTLSNVAGRSTYQNAGRTVRRGLELAWSQRWQTNWRAQVSATWLDATYRDGFLTCAGSPCPAPTVQIAPGNRIPGLARSSAYASLGWASAVGWRAGVEARWVGRVYVDDANSDSAGASATAALQAGYTALVGAWELTGYARVDNLFDRRYAGSVIVNEGNQRYFEPAPGRTWWAGASASVRF